MPRRLLALFALAWAGFVAPCSLSHAAPAATVDPAGAPAPTGAAPATPSTTIVVYGDSLADGVWSGLRELTKTRPEVALIRHSQIGAGLTRPDFATWQSEVAKQAEADQATIAIVMFGLNDTTGLRDENHKGYQYKTPGWREAYEHRVDWLIQLLKARGAAVLWVGLPVFRKAETNEDAKYLTDLYAEVARRDGARFLEIYKDFADPEGNFMPRIDDSKSRSQVLRQEDGIHFTGYGYRLLGAKVLAAVSAPVDPEK